MGLGDDGIDVVELTRVGFAGVRSSVAARGIEGLEQGSVHALGVAHVGAAALLEDLCDLLRQLRLGGLVHVRLVVYEAVDEHLMQLLRVERALGLVLAGDLYVVGETCLLLGGADALQDLSLGVHYLSSPFWGAFERALVGRPSARAWASRSLASSVSNH